MSVLRRLKRKMNKGKKVDAPLLEKRVRVKNGYLTLKFPLTEEQFKALDLLGDYMLSFVYGDRNMDNKEDAEGWAEHIKLYIDMMLGFNAYFKIWGDEIAPIEEVGNLFSQLTDIADELSKQLTRDAKDIAARNKR